MATEDVKRKEEEKARKKQKEKEKIEQLKKEGKFMTKAQKEEKARNERKLQQMMAAGINVAALDSSSAETKKKAVYENKKRGGRKDKKVSIEPLGRVGVRICANMDDLSP